MHNALCISLHLSHIFNVYMTPDSTPPAPFPAKKKKMLSSSQLCMNVTNQKRIAIGRTILAMLSMSLGHDP